MKCFQHEPLTQFQGWDKFFEGFRTKNSKSMSFIGLETNFACSTWYVGEIVHSLCQLCALACWWWNIFKVNYFHCCLKFVRVTDMKLSKNVISFFLLLLISRKPSKEYSVEWKTLMRGFSEANRHFYVHDWAIFTLNVKHFIIDSGFHFQYRFAVFFLLCNVQRYRINLHNYTMRFFYVSFQCVHWEEVH